MWHKTHWHWHCRYGEWQVWALGHMNTHRPVLGPFFPGQLRSVPRPCLTVFWQARQGQGKNMRASGPGSISLTLSHLSRLTAGCTRHCSREGLQRQDGVKEAHHLPHHCLGYHIPQLRESRRPVIGVGPRRRTPQDPLQQVMRTGACRGPRGEGHWEETPTFLSTRVFVLLVLRGLLAPEEPLGPLSRPGNFANLKRVHDC